MDENRQYYKFTEVCDMLGRQPVQIAKYCKIFGINFRYAGGQRCLHCADVSMLTEYIKSGNANEDEPPVYKEKINDRLLVNKHKALVRRGRYLALSATVGGTGEDGFWSCQDCMSLDGERFTLFDGYIESKDVVFISDEQYDSLLMAAQKLAKHKELVQASAEAVFRANVNTPAYIVRQSKMNKTNSL